MMTHAIVINGNKCPMFDNVFLHVERFLLRQYNKWVNSCYRYLGIYFVNAHTL